MVGDICNVDWLSEQLLITDDDLVAGPAAVPDVVELEESPRSTSSAPPAAATSMVCSDDDESRRRRQVDGSALVAVGDPEFRGHHEPTGATLGVCLSGCSCGRRRRVVVLDCRPPNDYLASHIVGAVHLAVPQLMLRRLTTGNLPASSVISCLQDEGREHFNRRWKSEILVLHDESSLEIINDVTSSSVTSTSGHLVSVLLRRLKEDGCRVCMLRGGYEEFSRKYPQLCVNATSTCCSSAADLDQDDGINVDEDDEDCDDDGFNDESSSMCGDSSCGAGSLASTACCGSAPPTSTTTTALGLQRLRLHQRHHQRSFYRHRLAQQQQHYPTTHPHHHHQHHHQFSCPSSLSSSSLSSCCSSNSSALSSVSSSSTSISSAAAAPLSSSAAAAASFPVEVLPYLYLGNARSSADVETLRRNGIRYILNVTPDVPNSFAGNDAYHYLQIPIDDHWSQDLTAYFPDAIAFIDEARSGRCGVLVHCLAGISRSVTVTVAYLMHALRLSLNDAFEHVRRCKPDISPNFSFMGQLLDYERSLSAERGVSGSSTAADQPPTTAPPTASDDQCLPSSAAPVDEDDDDDRSDVFLSPLPYPPPLPPNHQQQQLSATNNSRCPRCGGSGGSPSVDRHPAAASCCRHRHGVVIARTDVVEVRMTTPDTAGSGAASVGGGSSCYSSPVSSLSSLSSSSAVNAAASSSTSSSSSSAFDYEIIPTTSPMTSHFS